MGEASRNGKGDKSDDIILLEMRKELQKWETLRE
jgi:hypothetical protein